MKKVEPISDDFDQKKYDDKAPHPLQSWLWGKARKKMGIDVLRLGEFSQGKLENVFQLTFHRIPFTNYKVGYLPRSVPPSSELLSFLKKEAKKRNCIFIKIEPYVLKKNSQLPITNFPIINSPHPLFPNWTIILDLTKKEEELLKNMKPKTRYNIRLSAKKGVIVREETNDKGFEIFTRLYFDTCQRQGYFGHNYHYHKTIFDTLKNKISHILIAYYQNTPLGAFQLFLFNDILFYPYGGSSVKQRNLMAANLLMWEAIRFGKKRGAKIFDMWGSLPPHYDKKHPWAGFTRFKQGYGGKFVESAGSYDLVINKKLYPVYNHLFNLRNLFLKIKKSLRLI